MSGYTLCFTGISGSGKSTLAKTLAIELENRGTKLQVIDGDILRDQLGNLFGYTREERMKNSRVVRVVTKYLNDNDINAIVAIVAPYEEMRTEIRNFIGESYIEVYAKCSYEECEKRDVKGYYKKQKEGKMSHLNGADDIFEEPKNSEIIVNTEIESIEESVEKIISYLKEYHYVV